MAGFMDLTGKKFNRLTVIKKIDSEDKATKWHKILWLCKCDCGNTKLVLKSDLTRNKVKSCGCLKKELKGTTHFTHGYKHTRFYRIWLNMKDRCSNKNTPSYKDYGGRGINYCKEWEQFISFKDDMYESYLNHVKSFGEKYTTLDRKDNNKNYCKENCRWATFKEQNNNRRSNHLITYKGKTQNITKWAEEYNLEFGTLEARITKYGWSIEKALTTPVGKRGVSIG